MTLTFHGELWHLWTQGYSFHVGFFLPQTRPLLMRLKISFKFLIHYVLIFIIYYIYIISCISIFNLNFIYLFLKNNTFLTPG